MDHIVLPVDKHYKMKNKNENIYNAHTIKH